VRRIDLVLRRGIADRLIAVGSYLAAAAFGNVVWESAQVPLYTLWRTGTWRSTMAAVLHCSGGDVVIALAALAAALIGVGIIRPPGDHRLAVAVTTIVLGISYTVGSEYLNTTVWRTWAYTDWMPTLPWLGTGLAPLAQWIAVPTLAFTASYRVADSLKRRHAAAPRPHPPGSSPLPSHRS
jgi:hypothetical protein